MATKKNTAKPKSSASAKKPGPTKKGTAAKAAVAAKKAAKKEPAPTKPAKKPAAKAAPATKPAAKPAKAAPATKAVKAVPATKAAKPAAKVEGKAAKTTAKKPAAPSKSAVKAKSEKSAPAASKVKSSAAKAPPIAKKSEPLPFPRKPKTAKAPAAAPASAGALTEGTQAPAFELPDQRGTVVSSASLAGKPYVLYFYPKDNTPGCTIEACDFRDNFGRFKQTQVQVFGVSPDSSKSHAGFAEKFELPFTLLADADKSLVNAYGVWVKKLNYGREYMGVERSTFLVGADGTIKKVWRNVKVKGHADQVLEQASAL